MQASNDIRIKKKKKRKNHMTPFSLLAFQARLAGWKLKSTGTYASFNRDGLIVCGVKHKSHSLVERSMKLLLFPPVIPVAVRIPPINQPRFRSMSERQRVSLYLRVRYVSIESIGGQGGPKGTHLQRIEKIIEAPGNDDVVIKCYEEGDDARCYPYTA